jgi:hypothetical protein
MRRLRVNVLRLLVLLAVLAAAGCAARANPVIGDVRLALRVKTALLNDPIVGTQPIDVRATGNVVTLAGQVRSAADLQRTIDLARSVSGVADVVSTLTIDNTPAPATTIDEPPATTTSRRQPRPRLIGLGVAVRATPITSATLGEATNIGPLLRLPVRNGVGPTIGFSWTDLPIATSPQGTPGLAQLRMRPIMAGAAWGRSMGRTALSASIVGGWSFNEIRPDPTQAGPFRAIHATDSFVWRSGVAVWHDLDDRFGVNVFVGGLFTSPRVTFAADDTLATRRLPSRTLIVSAGLAYWLF